MLKRRALSVFRRAAKNFKRPKNREDSSDLDDLLTESIAAMQAIIFEILVRRCRQKLQKTFEKLRKKSATLSNPRRQVLEYDVSKARLSQLTVQFLA